MIYPKPYSIYLRGAIGLRVFGLLVRSPRVVLGTAEFHMRFRRRSPSIGVVGI